ncbi:MAG: phosphatidylcholine synthase [Pseudomonadota bacterium]|jgi:phosphatidylcholine synthase
MLPDPAPRFPLTAWAVHLLTGSGAVWALLAMVAVMEGDARMVFLWLGLALIVDGIDGPLARRAAVTERVPRFDGAALDLIVDYLTYVFVPVLFLWRFDILPQAFELVGCSLILVSSLHLFAKTDMKSGDNHFVGFPATWNLVVLYLWLFAPAPWVAASVVLALVALTFAPALFIHPFRVVRLRLITLPVCALWAVAAGAMVWTHPAPPAWAPPLLLLTSAWVGGLCLWRSVSR